jgi:hypothetical protein
MSRSFRELCHRIGAGSNRDNKRRTAVKQERAKKQRRKEENKRKEYKKSELNRR